MPPQEQINAALIILECKPGCTEDEVKSSYRQLVKVWHPDRFEGDPKLTIKATEKLKLVNDAYQILERFFESVRQHTDSNREEGLSEAEYAVGRETIAVTQERDPQSGQVFFRKVVRTVTGYNGRWLSTNTKAYKTKLVNPSASFEHAAQHSLSFHSSPEQGQRGAHWDYGSELGKNEHNGFGNEYQFPDGSSVSIDSLSTDTWFNDEDKKATHGRTSSSLEELEEAYQVLKRRQDWRACVDIGQRAVELHRENSWGWIQRSYALNSLKRTREAFDALRPAASLFPDKITIFYNLACYAALLGDLQAAKNSLLQVFQLAEKQGPYSCIFDRYQKMARNDPELASVRHLVPNRPLSWSIRKYFGI